MMDSQNVVASVAEREQLLNSSERSRSNPSQNSSGWVPPKPFICFHSLSVDYRITRQDAFTGGSLKVTRTDEGDEHDFNSILLHIEWSGRGGETAMKRSLSIDDLISYRVLPPAAKPMLVIQQRGGAVWGYLEFVAGANSLKAFERVLGEYATLIPISDAFRNGRLMAVDAKPRMRVAVRPLAEETDSFDDSTSSPRVRPEFRDPSNSDNLGMMILENFAKVTQFTRKAMRQVSNAVEDTERLRVERRRRIRESAARLGATDLSTEIVPSTDDENVLPPRLKTERARGLPVSSEIWKAHLDETGRLIDPTMMRHAVFVGGVEKDLRKTLWPILLGVFSWDSTQEQRDEVLSMKQVEYLKIRQAWEKMRDASSEQKSETGQTRKLSKSLTEFMQSEEQIAKDITRTDRIVDLFSPDDSEAARVMSDLLNIYANYDRKIRYCQGMSDFMSQIVYHVAPEGGDENETLAFWCFVELMKRIECNFRVDQSGMHSQLARLQRVMKKMDQKMSVKMWPYFEETDPDLYTCFRWILVRFKRELAYNDTAYFWEVLWTRHVGGDMLHIYVAAAILFAHRERILALPAGEFDSLLRYINDMSGRIDADFALKEGELLYRDIGATE